MNPFSIAGRSRSQAEEADVRCEHETKELTDALPRPRRWSGMRWVSLAACLSLLPAAPAQVGVSQRQFRNPDAAFTGDFSWENVELGVLSRPGRLASAVLQAGAHEAILRYDSIEVRVTAPNPGVFRIQAYSNKTPIEAVVEGRIGIKEDLFHPQRLQLKEEAETVVVISGTESLRFPRAGFGATLQDSKGRVMLNLHGMRFRPGERGYVAKLDFALGPDDHFWGMGGKTSPWDRRGGMADVYSVKVGSKRGDYGGFALPFFVNPRGYGFILNNPYPHVYFDFGYESADRWSLTIPGGPIDIFLMRGMTPKDIVRAYHGLTGAPALPEPWMMGFWVSWLTNTPADQWLDIYKRFRSEKWPVDVAVFDIYWRGGMVVLDEGGDGNNLDWAPKFGDGPKLVSALHEMGIRSVLHVNTRMYAGKTLEEGLKKGFLWKASHQQVVANLEDDAARDWNWQLYQPRVDEGVDLWWVDNGERVVGKLRNGQPSREVYGELWNDFLFRRMKQQGAAGPLVLARGGWLGTQTNAAPWPGDTAPGVERLQDDLWFVGNLAVSGVPYSGVDLGGFVGTGPAAAIMHTDENIIRRVAHGLLLFPLPRIHNHEGAPPKFPWRYSAGTQRIYRAYLELRYRLFPYYWSAAVAASADGLPITRPLLFDYPDDLASRDVQDEMLVGPSLLMAPVTLTNAHSRFVYLPPGEWYNFWTGEKIQGGRRVVVVAELHSREGLPIFVKGGAIIPECPLAQSITPSIDDQLELRIFPAAQGGCVITTASKKTLQVVYTADNAAAKVRVSSSSDRTHRCVVSFGDNRQITRASVGSIPIEVTGNRVVFDVPAGEARTIDLETVQ